MTYTLRLSRAARRSLERDLPEAVASAVWEFVSGDLLVNPHRVGKALRFDLEGYHSARRGMYRVIRSLRGDPGLQAGEESDPCGAGQG